MTAQSLLSQSISLPPRARRRGLSVDSYLRELQAAREWKRRHAEQVRVYSRERNADLSLRAPCEVCGSPSGIYAGAARAADGVTCASCIAEAMHLRRQLLVEAWGAGKTFPEIEAEFGWSRAYLSGELFRAREAGYDLPYRYRRVRNAA